MKAIMYHYVRQDDPELPFFRHLHVEDFEKQLDYFEEEYGFLSKPEFFESLQTGVSKPGVILTFDDGFKDHHKNVLPCLLKRNLWGIFYVPTGIYKNNRLLDVHRVHVMLGRHGGRAVFEVLSGLVDESMLSHSQVEEFRTQTYNGQTNDNYTALVKRTLNYFIGDKYRQSVMDDLVLKLLPDEKELLQRFYMNAEEIREMQESGMIVGSHTVNHPVMSKLSVPEQKKEIGESFDYLHQVTGGLAIKTFCYPYGGFHSFTDDTENILKKSDCLFSFNVEYRDIDQSDITERAQALPRYDCNQFPFGALRDLR